MHGAGRVNPFHALLFSNTPLKYEKTSGFLISSGGIERDERHEIGLKI